MIIIDNPDGLVSAQHTNHRLRVHTHVAHTQTERALSATPPPHPTPAGPARTAERNQRTCVIPPTDDYHDNKDDGATLLSASPIPDLFL